MDRKEHLLVCLSEECDTLRFGLNEVQPGQFSTNAQRIEGELRDLIAVAMLLQEQGILTPRFAPIASEIDDKRTKIEKFMAISRAQGVLHDPH